jgi:peptidoglycan hydrolase-like protein with peptidoglycan-binding domain
MVTKLRNPRWAALTAVVALVAASALWWGISAATAGEGSTAAESTTSTTAVPTTTTTRRPTTTTSTTAAPTTTTTVDPAADGVLEPGEHSDAVAEVQRRLGELHFDPGPVDGAYGTGTLYAVQGFQKLAGLAPDGRIGPEVQAALANPPFPAPLVPNGEATRIEVDLARQLMFVYTDGNLRLITHVSTGSGEEYCAGNDCGNRAITPEGAFRFMWRYSGWRESRLGKLYNPVYFTGSGIAVHGSASVPTYPASHGCVRIPMHIAEYFPSLVARGDAVYVLSGPGAAPATPPSSGQPAGPPPADPPTSPETTTTTAPPATTTTTAAPTTTTTTPSETTTTTIGLP